MRWINLPVHSTDPVAVELNFVQVDTVVPGVGGDGGGGSSGGGDEMVASAIVLETTIVVAAAPPSPNPAPTMYIVVDSGQEKTT
jgi:hypothetical protein